MAGKSHFSLLASRLYDTWQCPWESQAWSDVEKYRLWGLVKLVNKEIITRKDVQTTCDLSEEGYRLYTDTFNCQNDLDSCWLQASQCMEEKEWWCMESTDTNSEYHSWIRRWLMIVYRPIEKSCTITSHCAFASNLRGLHLICISSQLKQHSVSVPEAC